MSELECKTDTESAREFVEDMQERITQDELPILARYLLDMVKLVSQANDKLQIEAQAQGDMLMEVIRLMYRLMNKIHQLMNTKPLLELLERYANGNTPDEDDTDGEIEP